MWYLLRAVALVQFFFLSLRHAKIASYCTLKLFVHHGVSYLGKPFQIKTTLYIGRAGARNTLKPVSDPQMNVFLSQKT